MSYPPPRYHGDAGEASATFRPDGRPSELPHAAYLATGASTDGRFGLYRWMMGPRAGGPAPHFHRSISESFYVLNRTVRLYDGSGWTDATTGDFLYVPEGGVGERLEVVLPRRTGREQDQHRGRVVRLVAEPVDAARREAMDNEERAAFMLRHDTFWV